MLLKIALVVIFFSADGSAYQDFVATLTTMEECETAKQDLIKDWTLRDPNGYVVASCGPARPLSAKDI